MKWWMVLLTSLLVLTACNNQDLEKSIVTSNAGQGKNTIKTSAESIKNQNASTGGLSDIQEKMREENKKMGVAFLGYGDLYESSYAKENEEKAKSYLKEDWKAQYVKYEGDELYMIVPPSKEWNLAVYENIINGQDGLEQEGKCLYESMDGKPIILRCNLSDLISNVRVVVSKGDEVFEWSPGISLYDESVLIEAWVYNFSRE